MFCSFQLRVRLSSRGLAQTVLCCALLHNLRGFAMKRRRFLKTMAVVPAVALPAVPATGQQAPASPSQPQRSSEELPKLELTVADAGAEMVPRFFNPEQFAALRKLSDLLMP